MLREKRPVLSSSILSILIVGLAANLSFAQSFTVYFNNPDDWEEVYVYAWEDGADPYIEWPGEAMTEPEEDSEWYSYEIPDNFNRVIFNNNNEEQTADLIRNSDGWFDGTQWYDSNPEESFFLQIIHASADPAAAEVDIYVNADPAVDDPFLAGVQYQDITGYVDLDPDTDYSISLTGAGSDEVVYSIDVGADALEAGDVFAAIARGDFSTDGNQAADEHTEFGIDLIGGRTSGNDANNVELFLYHAVTDAPAVDIWVRDGDDPLVSDLSFGEGSEDYLSVPAGEYYLDLYGAGDSPDDVDPLQSFRLEADGAGGQAAIALATGYLAGLEDEALSPFEIMVAFADGTTVFPENVTEPVDEPATFTVYYNNPDNWDQVYAYTWEDGDGEYVSWPGEAMTEPEEGSDWYSYEIPANFNRVIFNNAGEGEQTADLIRNSDGWFDGTQWYDSNPDESFFLQIIHASADPAAAEVDIYVNADPAEEDPFLAGVQYQDITGYVDLDPDTDYTFSLTGAGSDEVVYSIDVGADALQAGDVFAAIARGDFASNGNQTTDEHTEFGIDLIGGRTSGNDVNNLEVALYHAVTDAPAVDVWVRDGDDPLVSDLSFGEGSEDYITVPAATHYLDLYAAGDSPDDVDPLQSFRLEADEAGGQAAIALATGYIAGLADEALSPFEVMVAFADGTTVFPANVTSSDDEAWEIPGQITLRQNYPNPFNPATNIEYSIPSAMHVELTVYNTLGQRVATLVDDQVQAGTHEVTFDGSNLASGVYIYRLHANGQIITNQMTLVK